MINFFQIAKADASVDYLYYIFGSMNGVIPAATIPGGPSVTISVLGEMFRVFNTAVLIVGILIVLYVTIVGVLQTAQEGTFMGRKWGNLWTPLRIVIGIAMLVPTASGFSMLQVTMMWVIVKGIGAADMVWGTAVNYVAQVGSLAKVTVPTVTAYQSFQGMFQQLVCNAAAKESRTTPIDLPGGNYFCAVEGNKASNFCVDENKNLPQLSPADAPARDSKGNIIGKTLTLGPNGLCGGIQYCDETLSCKDPNSIKCVACQASTKKLQPMINDMARLARQFQEADFTYRDFFANSYKIQNNPKWDWIYKYCASLNPSIPESKCCVPRDLPENTCIISDAPGTVQEPEMVSFYLPSPDQDRNLQNASNDLVRKIITPHLGLTDANFINTNAGEYTAAITTAIGNFLSDQNKGKPLPPELEKARDQGWLFAGRYYYLLANADKNNLQDAIPVFSAVAPDISQNAMNGFRNNYNAAMQLISQATAVGGGQVANLPGVTTMVGALSSGQDAINAQLKAVLDAPPTDILRQLSLFGSVMLLVVDIAIGLMFSMPMVMGLYSMSIFVMGNSVTNPLQTNLLLLMMLFAPLVMAGLALLITMGGLFAIYLPLVPFIIFTLGAIGWFLNTVETMVAGPLVALGIISPSEHHELLGKAEPALMLLFAVFLRPTLMIFGLIAAMFVSSVAVALVTRGFWSVIYDYLTIPGGLGHILALVAYVCLIVAVINKSFSLISNIPQQVMRWIHGGHGETAGEETALSGVKGGLGSAQAKAQTVAGGEALGHGSKMAKRLEERRKARDMTGKENKE